MRFIDQDRVDFPDGWVARAQAAKQVLIQASGDKTQLAAELKRSGAIWADVKTTLADLSASKCWYCEMVQSRSDLNVDHFRPKSRVAEDENHPGYWWLAVDAGNFRLSCQFCNQRRRGADGGVGGGKWDHFPLLDEGSRVHSPEQDVRAERVALLDPIEALDVALLTFDYDGRASPNPQKCAPDSDAFKRAQISVELYHLNHRGIVDQRKKLNRRLKRVFELAVFILKTEPQDSLARESLKNAVSELKRAVSGRSELTASARSFLRSRRADGEAESELVEALLAY